MEAIKEITLSKGRILKIFQDYVIIESPRDWSNIGTMMCNHSRYRLGDTDMDTNEWSYKASHVLESGNPETMEQDFYAALAGFDFDDAEAFYQSDKYDRAVARAARRGAKDWIILPLYLYDHSGITMNTTGFSCSWDSGQVGYIYVSKKRAMAELGLKTFGKRGYEKTVKALRQEVETYDQYLTGDVYGFQLEDKDGDVIDSCWGFYGSDFLTNGMLGHIPLSARDKRKVKQAL
jgi:hypothetical protein